MINKQTRPLQGKRVLIVAGVGDYSGACRMAHVYGTAFRASGWDAEFVVGEHPNADHNGLAEILAKDGFRCVQERGFRTLRCGGLIDRLACLIQEREPTFVLSTVQLDVKIVGPAARKAKVPYIVFAQNKHCFGGVHLLRALKKLFFGMELRRASAVIAVGPAVRDELLGLFRCPASLVREIPNGIDVDAYTHCLPQGRGTERIRILNSGRIDPQKGQLILVKSLALAKQRYPRLELDLAGSAANGIKVSENYFSRLQKEVDSVKLNSSVRFLGWVPDPKTILGAYDFYAHSALWEGPALPLSILEAMAAGLPVVMTDCAGIPRWFIEGVHGRVVKAGDVRELAEALAWMAGLSAKEQSTIGARCRELVNRHYNLQDTSKIFISACEESLRKDCRL